MGYDVVYGIECKGKRVIARYDPDVWDYFKVKKLIEKHVEQLHKDTTAFSFRLPKLWVQWVSDIK